MKKWVCFILSVVILFSLVACSGEPAEQTDTNHSEVQVPQAADDTQSTPQQVEQPTEQATSTPTEMPYSDVWNDKDFEVYGIFDFEPFDIGEYSYESSEQGGILVSWTGDFTKGSDISLQCARELYNKTLEASGKNADIVFDENALKWVLTEPYASFEEVGNFWESDDKTEYDYFCEWYYEYNGILVLVSFTAINTDRGVETGYWIYPYQRDE